MTDLTDPELDVLPKLLIIARDDEFVQAIVDDRVRGKEPQGPVIAADGTMRSPGDVREPGAWIAFVTLVRLSAPPHPTVPIQTARLAVTAYGRNDREAAVLRNACARALHISEPRVFPNGLAIFACQDISGGTQGADPDTGQPYERFIVEAIATTQAVV